MKLIHQYSDEATTRECSEAPINTTCNAEEKAEGDIDGPDDHEEDEAGPDLGHAPVRLTAGHLTHLNGHGVQEKCFFFINQQQPIMCLQETFPSPHLAGRDHQRT